MYVCLCKNITSSQIRDAVETGRAGCLRSLARELGVATQCGKCARCAREVVDSCARSTVAAASPVQPQVAV
ncbi:MAG: (2Fe-2S)-binding protein [Gammaproteobacteria bacterium]|nr:(2Fe-2S)-binding protein [Gammaproteobacteria bacterium]